MKHLKKAITLSIFAAMLAVTTAGHASTNTGGYGYQESRRAPMIGPAIALGTIALVAIIAVALQNQSNSSHGHGSS